MFFMPQRGGGTIDIWKTTDEYFWVGHRHGDNRHGKETREIK